MKGLYNPTPIDATPVNAALAKSISSDWAYDHAADLAAHNYHFYQVMRTGEYVMPGAAMTLNTAMAMVGNTLYAVRFPVPRNMTFNLISCEITAQGGQKIRMGIYNAGTNLYPGTRLLDAGEITLSGTGIQNITISQALTKGLYWLAIVSNGTPSIETCRQLDFQLGIVETDFGAQYTHWTVAFTYAALPTPFTAGGTRASAQYGSGIPLLALRLLSLD